MRPVLLLGGFGPLRVAYLAEKPRNHTVPHMHWVGPWYIFYFLGGCWFGGGFLIMMSSLVICFCDGVALLVVVVFRVRAS